MAHDAIERSLSEHDRVLEQQVSDLQAILEHLLTCINENGARIDRCMGVSAAAASRAELAIVKAQESVTAAELLRRVAGEAEKGEAPKKRRKLPPGWGGIVAGTMIALAALRAHHKAAAITGAAALLTAASAPLAAQMLPDTDARLVPVTAHHHYHLRQVDHDPVPAAIPPRRRHRSTVTRTVQGKRAPSPKATGGVIVGTPPPSPDPSPTATTPDPSPTATPTGTDTPTPASSTAATPNPAGTPQVLGLPKWDN